VHAVVLDDFGGPEVLNVRPVDPTEPGPDEVRVRVEFATVNPTDVLLRNGAQAALLESPTGPWTPGMELYGVIEATGEHAAKGGSALGTRWWLWSTLVGVGGAHSRGRRACRPRG
jgi:NADPH:quinone reductase